MKRNTVINILLIIIGILMALALFGAGAVWKSKMQPSRSSVSAPAAENDRSLPNKKADSEESMPENENVASKPAVSVVAANSPTVFRYDAFSSREELRPRYSSGYETRSQKPLPPGQVLQAADSWCRR